MNAHLLLPARILADKKAEWRRSDAEAGSFVALCLCRPGDLHYTDRAMAVFGFILAAVGGYLLGSIPFGLVLTGAAGLGDIRNIGSGNIGATNVARTGRWDIAIGTLVLDAAKAGIALILARMFWGDGPGWMEVGLVAGGAAFLGHCFPVWLNFKGGKGVATYYGVLFAGIWPLALLAAFTWVMIAIIFRYSSLAALCAAAIVPLAAIVGGFEWSQIVFTLVLAVLIFWRHADNIKRLRSGGESKIAFGKKAAETPPAPEQPQEPAAPVDFDAHAIASRACGLGAAGAHPAHWTDHVSSPDPPLPLGVRRDRSAAAVRTVDAACRPFGRSHRSRTRRAGKTRRAPRGDMRAGLSGVARTTRSATAHYRAARRDERAEAADCRHRRRTRSVRGEGC